MKKGDTSERSSQGTTLRRRGDSFQFEDLIDSLNAKESVPLATNLTPATKVVDRIALPLDPTAPTVPVVRSRRSLKPENKSGFFKRLFSTSNATQNWTPQAKDEIQEDASRESVSSSSRDAMPSNFRKPTSTGSTFSGLSAISGLTGSFTNDVSSSLRETASFKSFNDAGVSLEQTALPLLPVVPMPVLAAKSTTNPDTQTLPRTGARRTGIHGSDTIETIAQQAPQSSTSTSRDHPDCPILENVINRSPILSQPLAAEDPVQFGRLDQTCVQPPNSQVHRKSTEDTSITTANGLEGQIEAKARALLAWQDTHMHPSEYAAYLGEEKPFNQQVLATYIGFFDFHNKTIVQSLRQLCAKLYIRGETQVIDRVLESFSLRWRQCNRQDRYLTQDVTHIISFALITLNTDLHIANVENDQKMRKVAFANNTLEAILASTSPALINPEQFDATENSINKSAGTRPFAGDDTIRCVSVDKRDMLPKIAGGDSPSMQSSQTQALPPNIPLRRKMTLRKSPSSFLIRDVAVANLARTAYLRDLLQDMYISIKHEQIRQPNLAAFDKLEMQDKPGAQSRPSRIDLHSLHGGSRSRSLRLGDMLSRNSSSISLSLTGEPLKPGSPAGQDLDEFVGDQLDHRRVSPMRSSLGPNPGSQRALGFASSLSNVIIREETTSAIQSPVDMVEAIEAAEEDDLTLHGAPFAKEGRLNHKLHDYTSTKKSRAKHWTSDTFVVLSKGDLRMFDFSQKAMKSNRKLYGGGDWTQNARSLLDLSLVQTVAAALPDGTYLKDRPHIWALTMPDGVVHLFHVGTEELVQEWISTANYWAARTTKEPLLGAVDNAEYGWGACLDHLLRTADEYVASSPTTMNSSTRSRKDSVSNFSIQMDPEASRFDDIVRKYPGNRAIIREWRPEPCPLMVSVLAQEAQLHALQRFVVKLESELSEKAAKRLLLPQAFSPHHPNLVKVQNNYEKLKQYWESELLKYRTYIEALENGIQTADNVRNAKLNKNMQDLH